MSTIGYRALLSKSPSNRREAEGKTGFEPSMPSQSTLDKMAEESLSKGWVLKRSNRCPSCFTYRSSNGSCLCEA